MSFLQSIAGPSRVAFHAQIGQRTIATSSARYFAPSAAFNAPSAKPSTPSPARPYVRPPPSAQKSDRPVSKAKSTERRSHQVHAASARKELKEEKHTADTEYPDWQWEKDPVDPEADYTQERRTIYARPYEIFFGRPGGIKAIWVLGTLILVNVITMPNMNDIPPQPDQLHIPEDLAGDAKAVQTILDGQEDSKRFRKYVNDILDNFTSIKLVLVGTFTLGMYIATKVQINSVTRLTQIRRIPKTPGRPTTHQIELTSAMHDANVPGIPRSQIFDLADTSARLSGRNTGFIGFSAGGYPNYRMDLQETSRLDHADGDVVVSLARLERIYGKLTTSEPRRAFWSRFSDKVDQWAEGGPKKEK